MGVVEEGEVEMDVDVDVEVEVEVGETLSEKRRRRRRNREQIARTKKAVKDTECREREGQQRLKKEFLTRRRRTKTMRESTRMNSRVHLG
jgi:hypothetical protein